MLFLGVPPTGSPPYGLRLRLGASHPFGPYRRLTHPQKSPLLLAFTHTWALNLTKSNLRINFGPVPFGAYRARSAERAIKILQTCHTLKPFKK